MNTTGLRLSLTSVIILMVISSPIVVLVNPTVLAKTGSAPSSPLPTISTIPTAPSTIGQDVKEGDFSTQAALTSPSTKQTNNIVNTQSEFAVTFKTATTGTIKKILVTFPAGTNIGSVNLLITREGIGPGTAEKTSSATITYTVTNAVSVPAGTLIKLEFGTIVNSPNPGNQFVTVTTRTAANTIIDGPTAIGYSLKQIGTGDIADGAIQPQVILREGSVVTVTAGNSNAGSVQCLAGEVPVSGGLFVETGGDGFLTIKNQRVDGNGWVTEMYNSDSTSHTFRPRVTCMPAMP